jgi:hypothetical protein
MMQPGSDGTVHITIEDYPQELSIAEIGQLVPLRHPVNNGTFL